MHTVLLSCLGMLQQRIGVALFPRGACPITPPIARRKGPYHPAKGFPIAPATALAAMLEPGNGEPVCAAKGHPPRGNTVNKLPVKTPALRILALSAA